MSTIWRIICLGVCWGLVGTVLGAPRVALVMGNGTYTERPLRNPVNDAADVAAALGKLGFEVISERNLDRRGMHRALQAFREKLRGGQLGVFFYAGHGAQYQNRTYLIPINANINDAADLPIEALEAGGVLGQMQSAGNTVSVVILDACRNLPYPGADRAGERGLARLDAIRGSLVAYATSPGQVAQDGEGRNSPYTTALLAELAKPGQSLTELFNNVGWAVASSTQNRQEPWYSTSPLPKITLAQWNDQTPPAPPVVAVPTPSPQPTLPAAPLPVAPAPPPPAPTLISGRYRDNGDGTVTDMQTRLQWMRCALGQIWKDGSCTGKAAEYPWQQALDAAKKFNYAGYRDWRVPSREELTSLVYCSSGRYEVWEKKTGARECKGEYSKPTIDTTAFPNMPASFFWSASPNASYAGYAWYVYFDYGYDYWDYRSVAYHVRLVRAGQ